MEMLLLDFFSFLPVVADSFYNPVTQSLSIEVIGVGSTGKENDMPLIEIILAVIVGFLAAIGLEGIVKSIRKGMKNEYSRSDERFL
tara:strand:- start:1682 stop:1939 length:258 start_codon:yes stop_codon:yes gene_type:complete